MYRPVRLAPLPSTSTQPPGLKRHPGPEETWPGTVWSVIPAGTPVLVASGYPQEFGTPAQEAAEASEAAGLTVVHPSVTTATTAAARSSEDVSMRQVFPGSLERISRPASPQRSALASSSTTRSCWAAVISA